MKLLNLPPLRTQDSDIPTNGNDRILIACFCASKSQDGEALLNFNYPAVGNVYLNGVYFWRRGISIR